MMGRIGERVARVGLVVALLLLLTPAVHDPISGSTPVAHAAPGSSLNTVSLTAAGCAAGTSPTSLALVSGRLVGFPEYPSLLVVSCVSPQPANLSFITPVDVTLKNGTLSAKGSSVKTITTSQVPASGWTALALRVDKGDLIGCGQSTTGVPSVYKIDISVFTTTITDGTTVKLFDVPSGTSSCNGLAWDPNDNTLFLSQDDSVPVIGRAADSPDEDGTALMMRALPANDELGESGLLADALAVTTTVFHFQFTETTLPATPTLLNSFSLAAGCSGSGLGLGGASLFTACTGSLSQLNKTNGLIGANFGLGTPIITSQTFKDLECDLVTFGAQNREALWARDPSAGTATAFELPLGTCGPDLGGPQFFPRCPAGSAGVDALADTDGDGLLDCWETAGIDLNGDGSADFTLSGADKNRKDIYLEIDYTNGWRPKPYADGRAPLTNVINAFANAPVITRDPTNPNVVLSTGIALHITIDEEVKNAAGASFPTTTSVAFEPCTIPAGLSGSPDFDALKGSFFGTAAERANPLQRNAKRFAYHYGLSVFSLLGLGSQGGCSEVWGDDVVVSLGSWTTPGGTTDDQDGVWMHELGHNLNLRHGGDENTNCKPNYVSVMNYLFQTKSLVPTRLLDYSRRALNTLNEASLSEPAGMGAPPAESADTNISSSAQLVKTSGGIRYNKDSDTVDTGIARDVNNFSTVGCDGSGTTLTGYDDWSNLKYNLRSSVDFAGAAHEATSELAGGKELSQDELNQLAKNTVRYNVCPLYDETKSFRAGATVPVRLQLCDGNSANVSSASITLHAIRVEQVDNSASGQVEDSGSANPESDFRFDGQAYIYNLSSKGPPVLTTGTWRVVFSVGSGSPIVLDPHEYSAQFDIR
jgi:hypothetical protein